MYIQITSKCNMTCEHCAFACTMDGEDMSFETFKTAIAFEDSEHIILGGGEPTLHPKFWEFLSYALGAADSVWLATNGSQTERALTLAKMARRGILGVALSQDHYHSEIEYEVVEAFTEGLKQTEGRSYGFGAPEAHPDLREIRNVTKNSSELSTFRDPLDHESDSCICEGLFCKPNGDVHVCGCRTSPCIGNINDPHFAAPQELDTCECYRPVTGSLRAQMPEE